MGEDFVYYKTIKKEGNECLITKHAHVVVVRDNWNTTFIATVVTTYTGWMGFDSNADTQLFSSEHEAINFCEQYVGKGEWGNFYNE